MPDRLGAQHSGGATGWRRFAINALSAYGSRALLALSALLLTPYLYRTLGTDGFGTWSVMFTLTTVFGMLEVGFALGTTKFVAELRATGERTELERTLGASVALMSGLGVLALVACALLAMFASGLAADDEQDAFQTGMLLLGGAYLLRLPLVAYGSVLAGYQRYDLFNLGMAVTIVGSALGAVAAVEAGGGVLGVAIAYAAALVVGGFSYLAFLRWTDPSLRLRPLPGDRGAVDKILHFSSFTLLADSMASVGARLDSVVIAAIRNASAAAPFAAAAKLQSGLQAFTLPVIRLILPMTSDLYARGMGEVVIERLLLATRVTLQVTIPVAIAMALFSADIVDLWLGDSAPDVTSDIVTVLALSTLTLSAVPAQQVLIGVGGARTAGLLNTVEGLSNLAISIVLVSRYGAIGAAVGTLLASCLIGPANFPFACRATGCSTSRLLRDGLGRAILSSLPSVGVMVAVWLLMSPGDERFLLGTTVGVGIAALVGLLQLGPRRALAGLRMLRAEEP